MNEDDTPSLKVNTFSASTQCPDNSTSAPAGRDSTPSHAATPLPRDTPLRRHRKQLVHYLRLVACLRDQLNEARGEIAGLETIVSAQADTIRALESQREQRK